MRLNYQGPQYGDFDAFSDPAGRASALIQQQQFDHHQENHEALVSIEHAGLVGLGVWLFRGLMSL